MAERQGSTGSLQATGSKMLQKFTEVVDKVKGDIDCYGLSSEHTQGLLPLSASSVTVLFPCIQTSANGREDRRTAGGG